LQFESAPKRGTGLADGALVVAAELAEFAGDDGSRDTSRQRPRLLRFDEAVAALGALLAGLRDGLQAALAARVAASRHFIGLQWYGPADLLTAEAGR
jgi:hypothetical protein